MSDESVPHLRAVPGPDPADEAPPAPPERGVQAMRIVLVLALFGIVLYGAWQARRASELEVRVELLSQALREAEAEVDARQVHLEDVRGAIGEVRRSLDALQAISAVEPASEALPAPEAPAAD